MAVGDCLAASLVMLIIPAASTCQVDRDEGGGVQFEDAFRRHQREIYLYLTKVSGDRQLAEDLTQETFLRAFRAALSFRGESSIRTWLFAIARNVLLFHQRRRRLPHDDISGRDIAQAEQTDPATTLSVRATLATLALPAREALVLCDLLGFPPTEAAAVIGVTPNALRVRLHRARSDFRKAHPDGT